MWFTVLYATSTAWIAQRKTTKPEKHKNNPTYLDDSSWEFLCTGICWVGRSLIYLSGYSKVEKKTKFIDYKPFLGPEWKPKYEGAPTLISNHRSFLDICIGVGYFAACFVAKLMVKKIPGVGRVSDLLNCIYVTRVGDDAAASRAKVFEQIRVRQ